LLKSHSCGELNKKHVGAEVTLAGWVDRRRDHGGLIFIDLRGSDGIVQVVFNPETSPQCHQVASEMRSEYVVRVSGQVAIRPAGTDNPNLPTGEIEVIAQKVEILNPSKTPPFYINEDVEVDECLRLRYRYLDLRRPRMKKNLILRHQTVKYIRNFLDTRGFIDIETPILIKSTPEGARDYLVPSRLYPGKFYALPQSPHTRADRQPEFTQLDLEMSFIEEEDILILFEELFTSMVEAVKPDSKVIKPFVRLTYVEAMNRYGSDKPDLRYGLEIRDLTDIAARCDFSVFRSAAERGDKVKGIYAPGCAEYSRSQLDELNKLVRSLGAGGLVTVALSASAGSLDGLTADKVKSVAAKYLTLDEVKEMARRLGADAGDLLLIVAGKPELVNMVLGELRQEIGRRLELADPNCFAFAFVYDFPLLWGNEKKGHWESMHHPFTEPRDEDAALLDTAPGKVRGKHYDIICNGYEIGGGSIRIHTAELQRKIFRLLGYSDPDIEERFGHLLEAFDYGAPPHGGIAIGIDRVVMLLAGEETIREVIAFPKTQEAADLTFKAPAPVTEEQLAELHLRLREEK